MAKAKRKAKAPAKPKAKPRASRAAAKRKPAAKRKRAPVRRSKFTGPRRKAILKSLALGAFRYSAASSAGIGERTLKEWISRGRLEVEAAELADLEGEKIPPITTWGEFFVAVLEAEAQAEDLAVGVVRSVMLDPEDPAALRAATWYLERKHPRRWGSGHRVEVTGKDGGPLVVDARNTLLERLAKMGARKDAAVD